MHGLALSRRTLITGEVGGAVPPDTEVLIVMAGEMFVSVGLFEPDP
jgi:hypothetical protein